MLDPIFHRGLHAAPQPLSTTSLKDGQINLVLLRVGMKTRLSPMTAALMAVTATRAPFAKDSEREMKKFRLVKTSNGQRTVVELQTQEKHGVAKEEGIVPTSAQLCPGFTEEDLMIASPVVRGSTLREAKVYVRGV